MKAIRFVGLFVLGSGLVTLTGCMTPPLQPLRDDGTYCHSSGKSYRPALTCSPQAAPSSEVETNAKRFDADPGALTIYVIRRRWADPNGVVPIAVDGQVRASTTPASWVRLRLAPGSHRLSSEWKGRSADIAVDGKAGEIRYVKLDIASWLWGTEMALKAAVAEDAQPHARASRLVADVDFRR